GQRRALIRRVRFGADDREPAGEAELAECDRRLGAAMAPADDEDVVAGHKPFLSAPRGFFNCAAQPVPSEFAAMQQMIQRHGLRVAEPLVRFLEEEALPGTGLEANAFWQEVAEIFARLTPENRRLLAIRDDLQARIDAEPSRSGDAGFLREIGYL